MMYVCVVCAEALKLPHLIPSTKKKTYTGMEHVNDTRNKCFKEPKELFKGLTFIKRDRCAYAQHAGKELCRSVRGGRSNREIAAIGARAIRAFTNVDIGTMDDLMPFVITASFTGKYKSDTALGLVLSKMIIEESGQAPMPGSRIPYVIVEVPGKTKVVDRLTTVTSFLKGGKKIDAEFYLKNQLIGVYKQLELLQLPQHAEVYDYLVRQSRARIVELSTSTLTLC